MYLFDADFYEQNALMRLNSLQWLFPVEVPIECRCGAFFDAIFEHKGCELARCPGCGRSVKFSFAAAERRFVDQLKSQFAHGTHPGGWALDQDGPGASAPSSPDQPAGLNGGPQ